MKKILQVLLCAVLAAVGCFALTGCGENRDELLKLYSQGAYMDEDLFEEFEAFYKEKTGKTVTVKIDNFNSNEDMYNKIAMDKADYDLICPSDYMIQKMIRENLLLEVDKEIIDISADGLFVKDYIDATETFDPQLKYSVPFMYGTFGIVSNIEKTDRVFDSWSDLIEDNKSNGEIYLKQSMRDTYSVASMYVKRAELAAMPFGTNAEKEAYKSKIQSIFNDTSSANINAVKSVLNGWKGENHLWDDEDGKFSMGDGRGTAGLFWSCDAGYVMNDYENDSGVAFDGNKNLWYVVPKEGGNIYLDSFVISKYAKNQDAAQYFLQFLCTEKAALANSRYIGAVSPVKAAYDKLKEELEAEEIDGEDSTFSGFPKNYDADKKQAWKEMYIEMLFPSSDTLLKCGQMVDYAENEDAVIRAMTEILT